MKQLLFIFAMVMLATSCSNEPTSTSASDTCSMSKDSCSKDSSCADSTITVDSTTSR